MNEETELEKFRKLFPIHKEDLDCHDNNENVSIPISRNGSYSYVGTKLQVPDAVSFTIIVVILTSRLRSLNFKPHK